MPLDEQLTLLEHRVEALVKASQKVKEQNDSLKSKEVELIEKNKLAKSKVEEMMRWSCGGFAVRKGWQWCCVEALDWGKAGWPMKVSTAGSCKRHPLTGSCRCHTVANPYGKYWNTADVDIVNVSEHNTNIIS